MSNISEARGDYEKAFALQGRCIEEFERATESDAENASKTNPADYFNAVSEWIRLMAEMGTAKDEMVKAASRLGSAPVFDQTLAKIYIAMAYPELFTEYKQQLLTVQIDEQSAAYLNLLRGREASGSGQYGDALSRLVAAKSYLATHAPAHELVALDKWIAATQAKQPISGNFFALSRFPAQ